MNKDESRSWQIIHRELIHRINSRFWSPGELIPNEIELAEEFRCARATVNRALRELAEAGIVERRKKAGTRVALIPVRKATLEIPVIRMEIEQKGGVYRHALISKKTRIPPRLISGRLGLKPRLRLIHVKALHFSDNTPFLFEDRWINPEAVPDVVNADLTLISANEWLVQNSPFTRGEISFSAAAADAEEAELLATEEGSALFILDRTTWNGTQAITTARLAYAPGFRLHTSL